LFFNFTFWFIVKRKKKLNWQWYKHISVTSIIFCFVFLKKYIFESVLAFPENF
jgi:hypothetical protein